MSICSIIEEMVRFRMIKIAVEQFAILADSMPDYETITYSIEFGFKYVAEEQRIVCIMDVGFSGDNNKFLVLKTSCEFLVEQEDWNSFVSESGVNIPQDFLEHIAVHTVGTSRGILFCKTEGSPFNTLILPPVNVKEILKSKQ